MRNRPCLRGAVVLQLAMLDGRVVALARVVQQNSIAAILGNGETHGVAAPFRGNPRTLPSITEIAEFPQLVFRRRDLLAAGGARSTISRSQR
jgi:hypothetical protein